MNLITPAGTIKLPFQTKGIIRCGGGEVNTKTEHEF